jgi:hypothetical protein
MILAALSEVIMKETIIRLIIWNFLTDFINQKQNRANAPSLLSCPNCLVPRTYCFLMAMGAVEGYQDP